jgi:hypothetical protein
MLRHERENRILAGNLKQRHHQEDLRVDGRITWILNKKFWEGLMAYFPLIQRPQRKPKKSGEGTRTARLSHKPPMKK